jgi:hypothetical protein
VHQPMPLSDAASAFANHGQGAQFPPDLAFSLKTDSRFGWG